jgi:hypothetical protein
MGIKLKETFIVLWEQYFGQAAFPIIFYYTDMVENIEESFLITDSWAKVKKRISRG